MNTPSHDLLNVLIAAAESRNFREAAEKLRISQPAVSLKLRELERGQPLPVFSLEGKRKVLTHYGRTLYEVAKAGTRSLDREMEKLHRNFASPESLTVRIAGRYELLEYLAPHLDFAGRIDFVGASNREALRRLRHHEVDVAIAWELPDSAELTAKKLFASRSVFAIHESLLKHRRLTPKLAADANFLAETPCVSYEGGGHQLSGWARHVGLDFGKLRVKRVAEDWRTVGRLIEQGTGFGIVPSYVLPNDPKVARIELPASVLPPYEFHAVFESSLRRIKAFQSLLAFARVPK